MSSDSNNPKIINKGNAVIAKFFYCSSGKEYPMGTFEMYRTFVSNFSDSNVTNTFFSSSDGIKMLDFILTKEKCPIYLSAEMSNSMYLPILGQAFDIIKLYFTGVTNSGKTKQTYSSYSDLIPAIRKKSGITALKDSVVGNILLDICEILTSSGKVTVRDASQLLLTQGSIEAARNRVVNFSVVGRTNDLFLSPIDPSVFEIFRDHLKFIGEGTKVSDDSGHNIEIVKENLLKVIGYLKNSLKMTETTEQGKTKEIKPGSNINSIDNVNRTLVSFLQNPQLMTLFLKIMDKMGQFYPDCTDDINELREIFTEDTIFEFLPYNNFSYDKDYIGGTKTKNSLIIRITTTKEFLVTDKKTKTSEPVTKPVSKPRGLFIASMDDDSSSDDDDESTTQISQKIISQKEVVSKNASTGKKEKGVEIIKVTSSIPGYKIDLKLVKTIMRILNDSPDIFSTMEKRNKAKELYDSVIDGTFGEVKSEITPDWWQKLFLDYIKRLSSLILVGDTSGGKTFISMMGIRILFNMYLNDPNARFIYLAPTSQLAILQFANILTAYPAYSQYFGICCKSIVNIPSTARILIGTPNEVKKYMYQVQFHRDTVITLDNVNENITEANTNPFLKSCKILFIDEIQVLSPTYVQSQEIEQKMECKAIEEVMRSVSYANDRQSQVIGMSATLSERSIANIKQKISSITGIPQIEDIIYTHGDIGLSDLSKRVEFVPIMKKPVMVPIKIAGQVIETFGRSEKIVSQRLSNEVVEMVIRDAAERKVLPLAIYREDELTTIQAFKDFISYLERKNESCRIWHELYARYKNDIDSYGESVMRGIDKSQTWCNILKENIHNVLSNSSIDTVVHKGDFDRLIDLYQNSSGDMISTMNPIYSPELYGLLVEYITIKNGSNAFQKDIHPYYRFGVVRGDDFFNLTVSGKNTDSVLKKLLIAQDADPNSNSGSIIPLIMRGIRFGVGLITSSTPLGIQLEVFRFINIKSKQTGESAPIPILFCEYGMSMGVNFSLMSVAIFRASLKDIGPSELKQIIGRAGRRGNSSGVHPVVYGFNIENFYTATELETLDFDLTTTSSSFFNPNEIYDYVCKIIVKFENNKEAILTKNKALCELIVSGDSFKGLGGSDVLLVRKIQLAKYQISELFDKCKNIFPRITEDIFRPMYIYLQKAEFYNLNVQIS